MNDVFLFRALRCTAEEVEAFLEELEKQGLVKKVENEWIRVDPVNGPSSDLFCSVISYLFLELKAVQTKMSEGLSGFDEV